MSKKHVYYPKERPSISRRDLLKGTTFGLAGLSAAPNLMGVPRPTTAMSRVGDGVSPTLLWDIRLPAGQTFVGGSFYEQGILWGQTAGSGSGTVLNAFDTANPSSVAIASWVMSGNASAPANYEAFDSGVLYWINPSQSQLQAVTSVNTDTVAGGPQNVISNIAAFNAEALVVTSDGTLVSYSVSSNNTFALNWSFKMPFSMTSASIVPVSGSILVAGDTGIVAVDSNSQTQIWEAQFVAPLGTPILPVVTGDNLVFITSGGTLSAFEIGTGTLSWSYTATNAPLSQAATLPGVVFVGDHAGNFFAFATVQPSAVATPIFQESLAGGGLAQSQLLIEDGLIYLSNQQIWAVAADGSGTSSYNADSDSHLLGVENGIVYFTHNGEQNAAAVNMSALANGFFAESELMAEDYDGKQAPTGTPWYRTQVLLLDPNYLPRVNVAVQVSATEAIKIMSDSKTYNIDPGSKKNSSVWLSTDGAGELEILSTTAGVNAITTPALLLWSNFMLAGSAIVIYPDQDTAATLSSLQGSDLTSMQSWNGTKMDQNYIVYADPIAAAIRNTLGTAQQAQQVRQLSKTIAGTARTTGHRRPPLASAPDPNSYIAFPGAASNLLFQSQTGDTSRALSGAVAGWCLDFSGGACATPSQSLPSSVFKDWDDFKKDVLAGGKKIESIAASIASDGKTLLHTIVSDAKDIYQLAVQSLEDGLNVVAGLLKTLWVKIENVLETLSYLFNFQDIINNAGIIAEQVSANLTAITAAVTSGLATVSADLTKLFATVETNIATWVATLTGGRGVLSNGPQGQQAKSGNNNPQNAYSQNGTKSYAKSHWMTSKIKNNSDNSSNPSNFSFKTLEKPFGDLLNNIESTVKSDFTTAISQIKQNFSQTYLGSATSLVKVGFDELISVFVAIVDLILNLISGLVSDFFSFVSEAFDTIVSLLTSAINIPVLSDIFGKISPVMLMSLAISVPATIISKVAGEAKGKVGGISLLGYAALFGGFIYTIFDPITDLVSDLPAFGTLAYAALSAINISFEAISYISLSNKNDQAYGTMFSMVQLLPVVASIVGAYAEDLGIKMAWDEAGDIVMFIYGIVDLILSIVGAIGLEDLSTESPFIGKDGVSLISNVIGSLPYLAKLGKLVTPDGPPIVAVIDFFCDGIVAGLTVA